MTNRFVTATGMNIYLFVCCQAAAVWIAISQLKGKQNDEQHNAIHLHVAAHNWMMRRPWVTIEPKIYSSINCNGTYYAMPRKQQQPSTSILLLSLLVWHANDVRIAIHQRPTLYICANNKRAHRSDYRLMCGDCRTVLLSFAASTEFH